MDFDDFVARLDSPKVQPSGTSARCPAHLDHVASLMVNHGKKGGIVVKCHAGCTAEQIVTAMGLTMTDLRGESKHVATYDYIDEQGVLRYSVHRYDNPKTFRCVPGLPPETERILYQSQAVAWARDNGAMVYNVEGEKDADTLVGVGIVATTNVTGAGKWLPVYTQQLIGCHVTIIADNDEVGVRHARHVYASIKDSALTVALVKVPEYIGKDVSDLFDAGYTLADLVPLDPEPPALGEVAMGVTERGIEWAWEGYLPLGKVSLFEGDPGMGKSLITIDLAARWSRGADMPFGGKGLDKPTVVIMVTAEDDPADTLRPRLRAAGADLNNVVLVTHGPQPDEPFSLARHMDDLRRTVRHYGARIVILDPLAAFMGEGIDTNVDASVRQALWPLKAMAEDLGVLVWAVRHHNKAAGMKAIYRGGGSIGFTGAARAVFTVAEDPDIEHGRLFLAVKMNLAPMPIGLRYEIRHTTEETDTQRPYVYWLGQSEVTAQQALNGETAEQRQFKGEEKAEVREARKAQIAFMYDCLADGPLPWFEIVEQGKREGFTPSQLTRARPIGHLQVIYPGEAKRGAVWRLPTVAELTEAGKSYFAVLLPASLYSPDPANLQNSGSDGSQDESDSSTPAPEVTDSMRDTALDMAPLVCSVCGTDRHCIKIRKPHWAAFCTDHVPDD